MPPVISVAGYKIFIGNSYHPLATFLKKNYSGIFILIDENTKRDCLPSLLKNIPRLKKAAVIEIKSGEKEKNIETAQKIWLELLKHNADRKCLLVNLGGGVICDLGGWAATTYKRGIDFIHIPTTLLAQADACIGGKTGIDVWEFKNLIGTFKNPEAVFIFPKFLQTLKGREVKSGYAEIMKHGLIADEKYWSKVSKFRMKGKADWETLIVHSLKIKKSIVEKDPHEKNLRKVLNFGHTIGHAVESLSLKKDEAPLSHGEAIAIGMVCELYLSYKRAGFPKAGMNDIVKHFVSAYGKYPIGESHFPELIRLMRNDKKNEDDEIRFTLLRKVAHPIINREILEEDIVESLKFYLSQF